MNKEIKKWSVAELRRHHRSINFPEYQREPNIWSRPAKQRLIDSMLRMFDIACLYFYQDEDDSIDCIDGRQRIAAIMSFLGENEGDEDNGFALKRSNEVYDEERMEFSELEGLTFADITAKAADGEVLAGEFIERLMEQELTVVLLSNSSRAEEFNLQFARLNLGTILNSGEKLHAMVGDMRNVCFEELGRHPFLEGVAIPTRRYSKEQVAAQLLAQVFSVKRSGSLARTRHFDLQRFFKQEASLGAEEREWIVDVKSTCDRLAGGFPDLRVLRNRAVTVSVALQAWMRQDIVNADLANYIEFVQEFLLRLKWQVSKGLDVAPEYRYLVDFQRNVTQASVEKPAVEGRARLLDLEYEGWRARRFLTGDDTYRARTGGDASAESRVVA